MKFGSGEGKNFCDAVRGHFKSSVKKNLNLNLFIFNYKKLNFLLPHSQFFYYYKLKLRENYGS